MRAWFAAPSFFWVCNMSLLPPFTLETALAKVQRAEDLWNSKNPEQVALAYTEDTEWRNRDEFLK